MWLVEVSLMNVDESSERLRCTTFAADAIRITPDQQQH
jgi:hypothetical protein